MSAPNPARVLARTDHRRSYADPIRVKKGEAVELTDRIDEWDGHVWIWASASDGREGWVPDDLAGSLSGRAVARYDYDASELTIASGERATALFESHGWTWCRSEAGEEGWVPTRILNREEPSYA